MLTLKEERQCQQQEAADSSSNSDLALPFFTPWSKQPLSQGHHGLKTLERRENTSLCRTSMPSEWESTRLLGVHASFFFKKRKIQS